MYTILHTHVNDTVTIELQPGMVHVYVGQKLLTRNILRVFAVSQN